MFWCRIPVNLVRVQNTAVYEEEVYLVTVSVPSDTACLAKSYRFVKYLYTPTLMILEYLWGWGTHCNEACWPNVAQKGIVRHTSIRVGHQRTLEVRTRHTRRHGKDTYAHKDSGKGFWIKLQMHRLYFPWHDTSPISFLTPMHESIFLPFNTTP